VSSQPLYTFAQKTQAQIRNDFLRTLKNGLIAAGITNPNIAEGSDYYALATAFSIELSVVIANQVIMADTLMPDTAPGSFLDRWLTILGLLRRGAVPSFGNVAFSTAATTNVPPTAQLVDPNGVLFQVVTSGSYANGSQIPVICTTGGSGTNWPNGTSLKWVSAPAYAAPTVTVGLPGGTDGLSHGMDSEVGIDGPPRSRLLARFASPPQGGAPQDIMGWATQSSAEVQACAVYPALQGPATFFFAVWGAQQTVGPFSSTAMSRQLQAALVSGTVVPYVRGLVGGGGSVYSVGSSTVDQPTDVAFLMSLPSAPTASPAGPGGGWLDGAPWPSSVGGSAACVVTATTNAFTFTVNATSAPQPGVSRIAYLSPSNWQLYTGTVQSYSGSSGAYTVTINSPWPNLAADLATGFAPYVFPQSQNQAAYVTAFLLGFANLGPGEWTSSAAVKARAYRHPTTAQAWPNALDANFLRTMEDSGSEVLAVQYLVGGGTVPAVPGSIAVNASGQLTSTPPAILTPRNFGMYAQ
jgi:hypothetical protein